MALLSFPKINIKEYIQIENFIYFSRYKEESKKLSVISPSRDTMCQYCSVYSSRHFTFVPADVFSKMGLYCTCVLAFLLIY